MKYYECYEPIYSELKKGNKDFFQANRSLLQFFDEDVKGRLSLSKKGFCHALELGCGAGSVFSHITEPLCNVTAIDISQTAIDLAKIHEQNSKINFLQMDICKMDLKETFHLCLDSHFLHCLVDENDRKKALENIYNSLKPNGLFVLESMTSHKKMEFNGAFKFIPEESTLFKLNTLVAFDDLRFMDGAPYLAIRKINHALEIEKEIIDAGFKIIFLYVHSNRKIIPDESRDYPELTDPDLLRLIAVKE